MWERVGWILRDPGAVMAEAERERQTERLVEDTTALDREITAAERREANGADAIARGLAGPALDTMLGKLTAASERRRALQGHKAEAVAQRAIQARQTTAPHGLAEVLVERSEDLRTMSYPERRERLRRLGVKVVVAK